MSTYVGTYVTMYWYANSVYECGYVCTWMCIVCVYVFVCVQCTYVHITVHLYYVLPIHVTRTYVVVHMYICTYLGTYVNTIFWTVSM